MSLEPIPFGDRIVTSSVVVDDRFEGDDIDRSIWLPHYLPQWAGREASRARYRVREGRLQLFIDPDQPPWLPEVEGELRVSSLQTGCHSGPVGSTIGQHRTDQALRVVEEQPTLRLVTPCFAAIDIRCRWRAVADQMVALWMIGFEDEPVRSAEICVCEIFGSEVESDHALVGTGVHPFHDPHVRDDFDKIDAPIDVGRWHDYSAIWTADDVTFFIDGEPTKRVEPSPQYPMQLMLGIYDFAPPGSYRPSSPFEIDRLRILKIDDRS